MAAVARGDEPIHRPRHRLLDEIGFDGPAASRDAPECTDHRLTPTLEVSRRLSLAWGLHCIYTESAQTWTFTWSIVQRALRS